MTRAPVFLVNPASANGATGRKWPGLRRRAEALGLAGEVRLSERPGHLTELAAEVAAEGGLIVVVGGDGSLNEVVNGATGHDAEIAVIPLGTGRDFGRTYGLPRRFDEAVRVAAHGRARSIDVGRAVFSLPDGGTQTRLFVNAGSVGMSGAVARRTNAMSKRLGGRATFYSALVVEFLRWQNTAVTVQFEGGERHSRMHDVIVANGQFLGGGMKLAPGAEPDDGLFDLVLVGDVSKLDFVTTSPKLYSGGHIGHPRIEVVQSPWVRVESETPMLLELDGEHGGTTPVRFDLLPGALAVRVPG